ncbi:MAG: preprotein translocase subunit SecE [Firmicutes bacterium]|jgi:preprotein translocase subunit SecE|nr:preprotein translocase subunit SecE [Bacillota bacterium]
MASEAKPAPLARVGNLFGRIGKFLREVRAEFKRVQWPSRKELTIYTIVVISSVAVVAVFLGLIDLGLSVLVNTIIKAAA